MADDDEMEFTILNKKDVLVYQIPPASSSSGHKADDWKKCIWRGRCRVVGKGKDLYIKLLDPTSGNLFAQCAVPGGDHEKYVERVVDSSRYFVLKITNGDRHAFIGLGFEDRNDAFDFNVSLSDFKSTWVDRGGSTTEEPSASAPYIPSQDFSLKEGQKITVKIAGMDGRRRRDPAPDPGGGGFTGFLAPPPPAGGSRSGAAQAPLAPPPAAAAAAAAGGAKDNFFGDDDFGDFSAAPAFPSSGPDPFAAVPASPAPLDPFAASAPSPALAAPPSSPLPGFDFSAPAGGPSAPAAAPNPMGGFGAPLGGLSFGAPAPQAAPAAPADPFASINTGLPSSPQTMAAPAQQPPPYTGFGVAPSPPKPAQKSGGNAFDDLDIFK